MKSAKPKYMDKKEQESGNITYIYDEKHIKERNRKKAEKLLSLARTIERLRRKVAEDIDDPKKGEVAFVVALIDQTYERVGNPSSAAEGHFGVTNWRKKHLSFPGSKAVIRYKGKAGVDQEKSVSSKRIVSLLKGLAGELKPNDELFPDITSAHVNEYLKPFGITAKDIRGFHANEEMKKALKKTKRKGGDEKQRKEEFKQALEQAAKAVGHDPGTLKKDYLVPSFEENYLENGRIGIKRSASAADEEISRMNRLRTTGHIDRMLAIRRLAGKKDKKKAWEGDSAMLAIMAPPGVVRKLRKIVDSETVSPDGLHTTLIFLGKVADLDDATMKAIQRATERVCARHRPLAMRISGAGMFTPGDEGTPVYVVPNAKGLSVLQADLENTISSIIDLPSEHGWVPHMTVAYSCDDRPETPVLDEFPEWTANSVRFQAGGRNVADIPLRSGKREASEFTGKISRLAEMMDDVGDHESSERLRRQLDLLISRRGRLAPNPWRANLDYGERTADDFEQALMDDWRADEMEDDELERAALEIPARLYRMSRLRALWKASAKKKEEDAGEEAVRDFIKYWKLLLRKMRKRRKGRGK